MNMEVLKVRIIKAQKPSYWYADLIGQVFEVYLDEIHNKFIMKSDYDRGNNAAWGIISPEDCEVIRENFFDAIRNDPEMTQEQKDYWLAMEQPKEQRQ